jgi:hypothetical protein
MTRADLDAFIDRTARQMVATARGTSDANLLEAALAAEDLDRVLDLLDEYDRTNYELVVGILRARLPMWLARAANDDA